MGVRGHGYRSPYEVMAPTTPWRKWITVSGEEGASPADEATPTGNATHNPTAMLRIPRGIGVMVLGLVVGLILLAYWVGHQRGATAARKSTDFELQAEQAVYLRAGGEAITTPSTPEGHGGMEQEAGNADQGVRDSLEPPRNHPDGRDPREPGRNYFVMARDSRAGAKRLLEFLRTHGVDAAAISRDNGTLFKVVAMDHGFVKDELGGDTFKSYRRRLAEVGRIWEATHRGVVSFEKQGMYAERFDGSTGPVTVITPR